MVMVPQHQKAPGVSLRMNGRRWAFGRAVARRSGLWPAQAGFRLHQKPRACLTGRQASARGALHFVAFH